jgi:hypothetical protein
MKTNVAGKLAYVILAHYFQIKAMALWLLYYEVCKVF